MNIIYIFIFHSSISRLSPKNAVVPQEFATLLEMTLYKLVGNNLIPKTFINVDFWRKLRTKFTNAGQYAKIASRKSRKSGKHLKTSLISQAARAITDIETAPVCTPPTSPLQTLAVTPQKRKPKPKPSKVFEIPRDRPSSEDFVVQVSPRAKRVEVMNKTFFYYLKHNGITEEMMKNKE